MDVCVVGFTFFVLRYFDMHLNFLALISIILVTIYIADELNVVGKLFGHV